MYDIFTFTDQSSVGLILSNIIILLFLLIQTGFINYYRNSTSLQVTIVNIASIVILAANIAICFNTMVSSINVLDLQTNATFPRYSRYRVLLFYNIFYTTWTWQ